MSQIEHIIVLRFSAMGDVAMAVPVVKAILQQHPSLQITFVSNGFLAPLFAGIDRCHFFAVATKGQHKGLGGLFRLFQQLKRHKRNYAVADLHNVLRTKMLSSFFLLSGIPVATIDKGRAAKKQLTARTRKVLRQLPTSHERYADVFKSLGFPITLQQLSTFYKQPMPATMAATHAPGKWWVGVAPFAQHAPKMYPLQKMKTFLQQLQATLPVQFLFFGAPGAEAALLQTWQEEFKGSINIAGSMSFAEELQVVSNLKMMISMDSANMHLASIFGVPVLSIWGATHPFAGFHGFHQPAENIMQVSLYCRPCSVFGNKPCYRGDHACMHLISEDQLLAKALTILQLPAR